MKAFPPRSRTRCPLTPPLFNTVLEVLARAISQEKEKVSKLKKEEENYLYLQITLSCIQKNLKNPQESLELITNSAKLQITSEHKNQLCFYTPTMKKSKKEIKETISLQQHPKL